ncbi:hypothetical protein [Luteimonas deserti]|uniref:Haemolysin-type calcium binding-related domain-containing protein n=1 Tax=Luteimonas deserti TaxID=2752306 RepID=A0A7Z0TVW9_9GAMM|nr:hypothetical protein [Luteimonas deserti]
MPERQILCRKVWLRPRLSGGAGDDVFRGGLGSDKLEGGEGFDTYQFNAADLSDEHEDVIIDSDAQGQILFYGLNISGTGRPTSQSDAQRHV